MQLIKTKSAVVVSVNFSPMHQYSVDIFSYSGPSGILGSDGKQNRTYADARERENCCTFH